MREMACMNCGLQIFDLKTGEESISWKAIMVINYPRTFWKSYLLPAKTFLMPFVYGSLSLAS
jgi:hypothetical protein